MAYQEGQHMFVIVAIAAILVLFAVGVWMHLDYQGRKLAAEMKANSEARARGQEVLRQIERAKRENR